MRQQILFRYFEDETDCPSINKGVFSVRILKQQKTWTLAIREM